MYEVIAEKYVGKHGIYKKGAKIAAEEVMKGELDLALNGQKDATRKRGEKTVKLKDIPAKLKKVTKTSPKKVSK